MSHPSEYKTCPLCGEEYDPDRDEVVACPECGEEGSTACCMSGGRDAKCTACEEEDE